MGADVVKVAGKGFVAWHVVIVYGLGRRSLGRDDDRDVEVARMSILMGAPGRGRRDLAGRGHGTPPTVDGSKRTGDTMTST